MVLGMHPHHRTHIVGYLFRSFFPYGQHQASRGDFPNVIIVFWITWSTNLKRVYFSSEGSFLFCRFRPLLKPLRPRESKSGQFQFFYARSSPLHYGVPDYPRVNNSIWRPAKIINKVKNYRFCIQQSLCYVDIQKFWIRTGLTKLRTRQKFAQSCQKALYTQCFQPTIFLNKIFVY